MRDQVRRNNSASAPLWSERLYARLPRREIAYVKFILESYDNLAYMSVIDKYEAVLQIVFSPGQKNEVRNLMSALSLETGLTVLDFP
mgnify:CR=1 FL=1